MVRKPTHEELEQKVKDLEEVTENVLNNIPDIILTVSYDGTIYSINKYFSTEMTVDEIIGKKIYDFVTPDHASIMRKRFERAFQTGKPDEYEEIGPGPEGPESRWYRVRLIPIKQDNQVVKLMHIATDITEQKKAMDALRESEEMMRSVLKTSPVGISIYDDTGQCIVANDSFAKIVGTSKAQVLQQNYNNIESWKESGLLRIAKSAVKEQSTKRHYLKVKSTFGKTVRLDCHLLPFSSESLLLMIVDITEQKRAEEALKESESKFRTLFDLSPQAVALTELKSGRLVDVNNKFCEMTKYSKEEILGLNTTEVGFYLEEDRSKFLNELQASGAVNGLEMDFKAKDNSILHSLMFARIIQILGEPLILTVFYDVTEQKRLQTQLQQAQKMEAIGTLAGGIAHDFNNLLMGIQGRTSMMLMDSDSYHPHYEHLKGIEDYVKSAADLTKQLLGLARGGKYEVKPTDLNELINKGSKMFGRTKKEITIYRKNQKDIWTVEVDRSQIEQVMLNLYVNAWQSMPSGGELYLATENVILDPDYVKPFNVKSGKYVKVSITDTGVGMDKATQERIFDPFFTTKEMGRGTGLGLASTYGIIKNHGGFINVYSEKGEGATFNIYLPVSGKDVIEEKKLSEKVLKGQEMVLLVDDEDVVIEVGKSMLEKMGYKVITAKGGKEAIEIYKRNVQEIDLAILDMIMPEMDGGETYDKLKEINPDIKVLLSSGYSINGKATKILEQGCNGFIQKPFNIGELSRKIREILDKE